VVQSQHIETDELAFFPLLYWAVSPGQRLLSDRATEKLNQYLRSGGTIRCLKRKYPTPMDGLKLRNISEFEEQKSLLILMIWIFG